MNKTLRKSSFDRFNYKKRTTKSLMKRECDIYVTQNSSFKAQLKECEDLLNSGIKNVYLHCLGNAIKRGINIALNLVKSSNGVIMYAINTSTITFIDDVYTFQDDDELSCFQRNNSSLHIKIFRNAIINRN